MYNEYLISYNDEIIMKIILIPDFQCILISLDTKEIMSILDLFIVLIGRLTSQLTNVTKSWYSLGWWFKSVHKGQFVITTTLPYFGHIMRCLAHKH